MGDEDRVVGLEGSSEDTWYHDDVDGQMDDAWQISVAGMNLKSAIDGIVASGIYLPPLNQGRRRFSSIGDAERWLAGFSLTPVQGEEWKISPIYSAKATFSEVGVIWEPEDGQVDAALLRVDDIPYNDVVSGKASIFGGRGIRSTYSSSGLKMASKPSGAQKEAGNYKKKHIDFDGLDVSIENEKGTKREGTNEDGTPWKVHMHYDYGYIRRTRGVDGDHVDVYVNDEDGAKQAQYVYVVHQTDPETGRYDEDKCMLGFANEEAAKKAYLKQYDSPKFFGAMSTVPFSLFKEKVLSDKGESIVPDAKRLVAGEKLKSATALVKKQEATSALEAPSTAEPSADFKGEYPQPFTPFKKRKKKLKSLPMNTYGQEENYSTKRKFPSTADAQSWLAQFSLVPIISNRTIDALGGGWSEVGIVWGNDLDSSVEAALVDVDDLPADDVENKRATIFGARGVKTTNVVSGTIKHLPGRHLQRSHAGHIDTPITRMEKEGALNAKLKYATRKNPLVGKLADRLTTLGGSHVLISPKDNDLKRLLEEGKLYYEPNVRNRYADLSIYLEHPDKYNVNVGYYLRADDGVWRKHYWVTDNEGKVYEPKDPLALAYFGVRLHFEDAVKIAKRSLKEEKHLPMQHDQKTHGRLLDVIKPRKKGNKIVLHGTPSENLKSILKEGLTSSQFSGWAEEFEYNEGEDEEGRVFVTTNETFAEEFGAFAADNDSKDKFVVLAIEVPKGTKLRRDPNASKSYFRGEFPKSWIRGYTVYSIDRSKKSKKESDAVIGYDLPYYEPVETKILKSGVGTNVYIPVQFSILGKVQEKHLPGQHDQRRHAGPYAVAREPTLLEEGYGGGGENISPAQALKTGHHIKRFTVGEEEIKKVLKNGEVRVRKRPVYKFVDSITGKEITDAAEVERLRKLAPPNVTDVLLNPDPNGVLQSIWKDSKGRPGGKRSKAHSKGSAQQKWDRAKLFNRKISSIRRRIKIALESENPKEREAAAILYLIDKTAFRKGGLGETKADVQAYGASTLLGKHAKVDGTKVTFDFIGKKGVRIQKSVRDPILAKIVNDRKTSQWSQPLFSVSGEAANKLLKQISGDDFSVKDFRNWHATRIALSMISKRKGPAPDEKTFSRWQKEVATKASKFLGNTPSVSLNEYINPNVWDAWRKVEWGPFIPKKIRDD